LLDYENKNFICKEVLYEPYRLFIVLLNAR